MKTCGTCKADKAAADFHKQASRKDGLTRACKICNVARVRAYRAKHPEKVLASKRASYIANAEKNRERSRAYRLTHRKQISSSLGIWRERNKEKVAADKRRYAEKYPERHAKARKAWAEANPHNDCVRQARRRATKIKATPAWANNFFIEEAYDLARRRTEVMGFPWHVDHIVPLKSKLVCGLHWEQNLQVIPGTVNSRKSNVYWPDMP